jgi:hypothetical protein
MLDSETPIPASPNFEKLKAKLRELFELDKADLDFGIIARGPTALGRSLLVAAPRRP